jgi:hypothetical protein
MPYYRQLEKFGAITLPECHPIGGVRERRFATTY